MGASAAEVGVHRRPSEITEVLLCQYPPAAPTAFHGPDVHHVQVWWLLTVPFIPVKAP